MDFKCPKCGDIEDALQLVYKSEVIEFAEWDGVNGSELQWDISYHQDLDPSDFTATGMAWCMECGEESKVEEFKEPNAPKKMTDLSNLDGHLCTLCARPLKDHNPIESDRLPCNF